MPVFSRLLLLLAASLFLAACQHGPRKPALYQYSTLAALMAGNYEGQATVGDLASKGDFGLGTFNGLDGEMVVLDGTVRRADSGLRLNTAAANTLVPFASLVFFAPQGQAQLPGLPDLPGLSSWLDTQIASSRLFAAAKVQGTFARLTIRSVPAFSPPYPGLMEALKSQTVRELSDASGTLVGIRAPAETSGTAVPGWHFHFVSADGTTGGHVLAATPAAVQAAWMSMDRMVLDMPTTGKAGTAAEIPGETVGGATK
ncbi:acetolactate decarboxylase [Fundidesulfovibrio putealis]|uniref:acetolactate decarboxylase n=1 Tax=Fundidesulfovibrio putealis TaxID=270496 RepID=UPI0003FBF102|nr:acetolactate decarboxylase [Fundidesulfovibrio putealis]